MTTKDEALKLALEALDLAKRSHGVMLLSDPLQEAWKAYRVDDTLRNAITAIREALAEQPKESPKFDPNESFAREEAAQARVREFMRNH